MWLKRKPKPKPKPKPRERWTADDVADLFSTVKSLEQDFASLTLTFDNGEMITVPNRAGMRGKITMDMPKHPDQFNTTGLISSHEGALRRVAARDN